MNAPDDIRLPPHSVEAEQSVIGALLIDPKAWDRVADVVTESDFYRDDHRRIFGHIRALAETSKPVDVLTVFEAIQRSNEVDQTGGLAYLGEIANATPSSASVVRYAEIVAEKARLRGLEQFAADVQGIVHRAGNESAAERIDEATGLLLALSEAGPKRSEPKAIGEVLGDVVNSIQDRMDRGGEISGLPTGLADLDRLLDGLKDGDLAILAGRPSMGKTAMGINIAEHVAVELRKPVLVFSLEMAAKQLTSRSLSSIGRINGNNLSSGRMSEDEWNRVSMAMSKLHQAPLIIDDSSGLSAGQIRARARRQKRKTGLSLIVIDYVQLMAGSGQENRHQELSAITKALKAMAKDLSVPVIALSQLSRKVEERGDKRPMMSDLRESGAIEEDADMILMMYRDEYYNPDSAYRGIAEILVRKNRMGQCGEVKVVFRGEFSRFSDADHEAIDEANQRAQESKAKKSRRGFDD